MNALLQSGVLFLLLFLVSLPLRAHLPTFVHVCAIALAVDLVLVLIRRSTRSRAY